MHKKSIEAAETLKSSDENSDKEEETRTEASDTSSSNHQQHHHLHHQQQLQRKSPAASSKNDADGKAPIESPTPSKSSSISPVTMSPPISNHHHQQQHPSTPTHQRSATDLKKEYSLMGSPTSTTRPPTNYHLSPQDAPQAAQHPPPIAHHHHTHPAAAAAAAAHHYALNPINATPDTDPEVFRWVNYNRDVSFIRWILILFDFRFHSRHSLQRNAQLTRNFLSAFRNNSIACLRAKAQEHQARLMNSGLLALQVRSLAGLQQHQQQQQQQHHQLPSPMSSSPKSCDSAMMIGTHHSPSPIRSPESNNNNCSSRNNNFNNSHTPDMNEDIDIEDDIKPVQKAEKNFTPNVITFSH